MAGEEAYWRGKGSSQSRVQLSCWRPPGAGARETAIARVKVEPRPSTSSRVRPASFCWLMRAAVEVQRPGAWVHLPAAGVGSWSAARPVPRPLGSRRRRRATSSGPTEAAGGSSRLTAGAERGCSVQAQWLSQPAAPSIHQPCCRDGRAERVTGKAHHGVKNAQTLTSHASAFGDLEGVPGVPEGEYRITVGRLPALSRPTTWRAVLAGRRQWSEFTHPASGASCSCTGGTA